ncbi:MAG: hypothetical protein P8124_04210 [Gammaproteobacteria bacterium]
MKALYRAVAVATAMAIGPSAFAVPHNHARKLFLASAKSRHAFVELEAAAKSGNAAAQDWLGLDYQSGYSKGLSRSYQIALKWFEKAARKGDANAEFNLGQMYQVGAGVPRNFAKARHWYRLAAAGGSTEAKYSLEVLAELAR